MRNCFHLDLFIMRHGSHNYKKFLWGIQFDSVIFVLFLFFRDFFSFLQSSSLRSVQVLTSLRLRESLWTADSRVLECSASLPFSVHLHLMRNKMVSSVCFAPQAPSPVAFFIQRFRSDTVAVRDKTVADTNFFILLCKAEEVGKKQLQSFFRIQMSPLIVFLMIYVNSSCLRAWRSLHEIKFRDTDSHFKPELRGPFCHDEVPVSVILLVLSGFLWTMIPHSTTSAPRGIIPFRAGPPHKPGLGPTLGIQAGDLRCRRGLQSGSAVGALLVDFSSRATKGGASHRLRYKLT